MPIGDPRDGFFYPTLKLMIDSYNLYQLLKANERDHWEYASVLIHYHLHVRIQNFFSEGVQLWQCFFLLLLMSGSKYHLFQAIIGPPAKHHLNGVSLGCQWWPIIEGWLSSFVIFQGIQISIAKKPYTLWFSGGFGPPVPRPPLDPHMIFWLFKKSKQKTILL